MKQQGHARTTPTKSSRVFGEKGQRTSRFAKLNFFCPHSMTEPLDPLDVEVTHSGLCLSLCVCQTFTHPLVENMVNDDSSVHITGARDVHTTQLPLYINLCNERLMYCSPVVMFLGMWPWTDLTQSVAADTVRWRPAWTSSDTWGRVALLFHWTSITLSSRAMLSTTVPDPVHWSPSHRSKHRRHFSHRLHWRTSQLSIFAAICAPTMTLIQSHFDLLLHLDTKSQSTWQFTAYLCLVVRLCQSIRICPVGPPIYLDVFLLICPLSVLYSGWDVSHKRVTENKSVTTQPKEPKPSGKAKVSTKATKQSWLLWICCHFCNCVVTFAFVLFAFVVSLTSVFPVNALMWDVSATVGLKS